MLCFQTVLFPWRVVWHPNTTIHELIDPLLTTYFFNWRIETISSSQYIENAGLFVDEHLSVFYSTLKKINTCIFSYATRLMSISQWNSNDKYKIFSVMSIVGSIQFIASHFSKQKTTQTKDTLTIIKDVPTKILVPRVTVMILTIFSHLDGYHSHI